MKYHYDKKKRKNQITYIVLIIFLILVLFTPMYSYFYDFLEKPFTSISVNTSQIDQKSENIFKTWFSKKKLVEENKRLKTENQILLVDNLRTEYLEKTLETIHKPSFSVDEYSFVIQKNNNGIITINGGSKQGREIGEMIISQDGSLIGIVSNVFDITSYVSLFSENKRESTGILFPQDVSIIMYGNGNALVADLQRDFDVAIGDLVYSQDVAGRVIGRVSHIDFDPRDPVKTIFISRIHALESLQIVGIIKNN